MNKERQIDAWLHPAMLAAWNGKLDQFTRLLDEAPELVTRRSTCSHPTLLQFVVLAGAEGEISSPEPFMEALIQRGADLEEPTVAAASIGSIPITSLLLAKGASLEAGAPWTPLEESIYWAHRDLADHLRQRGAEVPSLRVAAGLGDLGGTERFLANPRQELGPVRFPWGCPSTDRQDVLDQALVIAAKNGQISTVGTLLEGGADVNAFPPGIHENGAALHMAAMFGHSEVVRILLEGGADPALPDPTHGSNAAGWAKHGGFPELAARLRGAES